MAFRTTNLGAQLIFKDSINDDANDKGWMVVIACGYQSAGEAQAAPCSGTHANVVIQKPREGDQKNLDELILALKTALAEFEPPPPA